jgi:hypothetical protein
MGGSYGSAVSDGSADDEVELLAEATTPGSWVRAALA